MPEPIIYERQEPEPLWLKLPVELAPYFDLGFVHSEPHCPTIVLRVTDMDDAGAAEVVGPPIAFLDLASVIANLCKSVPCMAHVPFEESDRPYQQAEAAQRRVG